MLHAYFRWGLIQHETTGIGEVWANMLHVVHADLVDKYGFSTNAIRDPSGLEGNVVFLHLFIDALALQPIRPTCEFNWFEISGLHFDIIL